MSTSNREVVTAWFEQVWNAGDEDAIDRLMSTSAKFHGLPSAGGDSVVGPAAFKPFVRAFRQAFPDIKIRVLRTVSEGELVACHCGVVGTHSGPGLGVEATGAPIEIYGIAMAVIRDGRIQEGWNCFDFMSLYQQVGMLPPLPATQ